MNERVPAEPQPVAGEKGVIAFSVPGTQIITPEPAAAVECAGGEPRRSFFRGVAVGLAVMVPIWVWVILRILG